MNGDSLIINEIKLSSLILMSDFQFNGVQSCSLLLIIQTTIIGGSPQMGYQIRYINIGGS